MPSLVVIGQQIKDKRRGGGRTIESPACIITKYPSLGKAVLFMSLQDCVVFIFILQEESFAVLMFEPLATILDERSLCNWRKNFYWK